MAKKPRVGGHEIKNLYIPVNRCFACGQDNAQGMHLKFHLDEAGRRSYCKFRLPKKYQGPPGHAHGGVIATILDEAMGKVNKLRSVIALTKQMEIEYLKPVPLEAQLFVEGHEKSVRGRKHINVAEIRNQKNEVLARGRGLFIAIDPIKMFAKHVR
ncbi:MAG TPA: PaaI family thioesterase [Candidatus Angelobacter sp.]|nr:PaaI family thioesterase [Candidatus Angelobacter sp.]